MKLKAEQIRKIQARAEAYQEREIRQPSIDGEQDRIKNTLDSLNEYGFVDEFAELAAHCFVDIPALLDHVAQIEEDLDKAEKRVKLLEGAIERQNNTISYLSSTNGQGFNW